MKSFGGIFLLVILCQFNMKGQEPGRTGFNDTINNNHYLKFNLTSIFDYEPGIQLAYSYPVNGGRSQIQHELSYITWNNSYMAWIDHNTSYHGVRLRNQWRRYYLKKNEEKDENEFKRKYVAVDLMYKYGNIWQNREIPVQGGSYFEYRGITTHKHVGAAHALIGWESEPFAGSKTMLDYYLGVGFRYKSLNCRQEGLSESEISPFFYDHLNITTSLSLMMGMRISLVL